MATRSFAQVCLAPLFLTLLITYSLSAAAADPVVVDATFQDRTSFSSNGADVQVVFLNYGITTLIFRVYDSVLLDVQATKGTLDGKPGNQPRISADATVDNAYRDNFTLAVSPTAFMTVGTYKVVPLYQTRSGHRVYYVADSYKENGDTKRFRFLVQPPEEK